MEHMEYLFALSGITLGALGYWLLAKILMARKQLPTTFAKNMEAIEAANRSKSKFLANMSHEVRSPTTAILGYAEMMLDPKLGTEERQQALHAIRRNAGHLVQIVNDILDLSKIEAGKLDFEYLPTSPWHIILDVVSTFRVTAQEKGLELQAC